MLSVIVVSFNTREITLKCLSSLRESLRELKKELNVGSEVIVVDNASNDGSAAAIKKQFSEVKLIQLPENTGFAHGNNLGMKAAFGEWILLLNSDAFLEKGTLPAEFKFIKDHPEADMLGCRLLNADGSIQPSYGFFPTLARVFALMFFIDNLPGIRQWARSIHVRDVGRYQTPLEVDWVTGAWVLLKKEVFEKTDGIDEKYFMYGEEMEWMYRARKLGYSVWFSPAGECTHLGGASGKNLGRTFALEMQGYIYWYKKHAPAWKQGLLWLILVKGAWFKAGVWWLVGNPAKAKANLEAARKLLNPGGLNN